MTKNLAIKKRLRWWDADSPTDTYAVTLVMSKDPSSARWNLTEIGIESETGKPITVETYRKVPITKLSQQALSVTFGSIHYPTELVGAKRGATLPHGVLEEVARIYNEALSRGLPPIPAIAQAFSISKSTSAKRVMLARKNGLLGKATRGKAG